MRAVFSKGNIGYLTGVLVGIGLLSISFLVNPALQTKAADNVMSEKQNALQVFNRIPVEDEQMVQQIVLEDRDVQVLIEGKEYSFNVEGHDVHGKDWNLALGVILKPGTDVNNWLMNSKSDKSVIEEYVGVLNIGQNDGYKMSIDVEGERVSDLTYFQRKPNPVQELTLDEKKKIVEIALDDQRIKELLESKNYMVAPEGVNLWIGESQRKIGGTINIWLDRTYGIEYNWPYPEFDNEKYPAFPNYKEQSYRAKQDVKAFSILVDLEKQRIVGILRHPVNEHTEDLYQP